MKKPQRSAIESSVIMGEKHGKSSKIKKYLDYLGVFIYILLLLGKTVH